MAVTYFVSPLVILVTRLFLSVTRSAGENDGVVVLSKDTIQLLGAEGHAGDAITVMAADDISAFVTLEALLLRH